MDDGQQVKRGGVTLCTDSYKSEEISILRNAINSNFNLLTSIHKKMNVVEDKESFYERIYISKQGFEEFKPVLHDHMHPSMLYKINVDTNLIKEDSNINDNEDNKKIIKQDSSLIENDLSTIDIDIFGEG